MARVLRNETAGSGEKRQRRNEYAYRAENGKNRQEHIIVWERAHGPVPPGVDVHHKNENKKDNRLENLEAIAHADHARLHIDDRLARYWATVAPREYLCCVCGAAFRAKQVALTCSAACSLRKSRASNPEGRRARDRAYRLANLDKMRAKGREAQRRRKARLCQLAP